MYISFVEIVFIFLRNLIANVKSVAYIDQSISYKWEKWSDSYTKVHYTEATQKPVSFEGHKRKGHIVYHLPTQNLTPS